jgi:hypothetical protein
MQRCVERMQRCVERMQRCVERSDIVIKQNLRIDMTRISENGGIGRLHQMAGFALEQESVELEERDEANPRNALVRPIFIIYVGKLH